jgi:hypothetical protein
MAKTRGVQPQPLRGERRSKSVKLILTPTEKAQVNQLATDAGQSASAWLYALVEPLLPRPAASPGPGQDPLPFTDPEQTE